MRSGHSADSRQSLQYSFFHSFDDADDGPLFASRADVLQLVALANPSTGPEVVNLPIRLRPWATTHDRDEMDHQRVGLVGPDASDRPTVINLAKMTSDAYVLAPSEPDWINTTLGYNYSSSFGWKGDGIRGHVFTDQSNKTVIISFKGTTVDPREKWRANDRVNDNILFSCCCGDQRPDPYPYAPVCGCKSDIYTCNETCLTLELGQKDRYYPTSLAVMHNITMMFPGSDFWLVGHSMGGAMASLLGLTFGFPAVTFESPGDDLPARRLGLSERSGPGAYHFGNTADPVFMGACNGWTSICGIAGYAFESQRFTGKRCVYDTVGDYGWHLNIGNHRINTVIPEVLEKYNEAATCEVDNEAVDCFNWRFGVQERARKY